MPRIGYARVSTSGQDLEIQIEKLKACGCEIIRSETGSGASRDGRTKLETIMEFLREGDELVVHRLDRLGRSTRDVLNLVHDLDSKGASLRILEPEVTTAGDLGRLVVTVLGMVADMELKFIRDRQRAGIDAARDRGAYKGRKKQVDDDEIRRLAKAGRPKAQDSKRSWCFQNDGLSGAGPTHSAPDHRHSYRRSTGPDSRATTHRRGRRVAWPVSLYFHDACSQLFVCLGCNPHRDSQAMFACHPVLPAQSLHLRVGR